MTDGPKLELSPKAQAAWDQRMSNHKHNGLYGSSKMMQAQAHRILSSPTCTPGAKQLATQIHALVLELQDHLGYRVNLDGTTTKVQRKVKAYE